MKKGDARRRAILEMAEKLFFDNGYENTSVQDILDELQLSKGGFYHHFESKFQLLEAICEQRAEAACGRGLDAVAQAGEDPVKRLNALFREGGFFGEDNIKYIALMLRTAYGGELHQLRERMRQATMNGFQPILAQILTDGMEREVFYLREPASTARLILMLACDVNDEVAVLVAGQRAEADLGVMIDLLNTYRSAVETLLNAPYGSVELIDVRRIADVLRSLSALNARGNQMGERASIFQR